MPAPEIRSVLFGKLAVGTRFITEEQLQECLLVQREIESRGGVPPKLGQILEEKGYLTAVQIRIILESMAQQQKRRFGEIAMAFQFLKQDQVDAAVELQLLLEAGPTQEEIALIGQPLVVFRRFFSANQSGAARPQLGEILLALGHLRAHQVEAVLEEQGKRIRTCGSCQASLNIAKFKPGQKVRCAQCAAVLEVVQLGSGEIDVQLPPSSGIWDAVEIEGAVRALENAPPPPALEPEMKLNLEVDQRRPSSQSRGPLPSKLGDFKILQLLGEDATGRTLKAQQVSRDRVVALKVMRRAVMADDVFRERFLEVTKKAAALDHPNLRKLYSVVKIGERYCVAMEFIEGNSVFGVLQKQGPFHFDEAVRFIRPVLQALAYAHRNGIVHGDVRPSNVMITPDGSVKLTNCGLSPRVTDNILAISESGSLAPFYIAPELITADRPTDHRIDIYSVGATLFHMISGKPPYQGKSPFEVLVRLSQEQIPPLQFFDPAIPEALSVIVHRMLDPEPDRRYLTCEEVLADLDLVKALPKVQAATAAGKSRRGLFAFIAVAVALLAGGLGWHAWSSSSRATAFDAVLQQVKSPKNSRADYEDARRQLQRFATANPGTGEADSAGRELEVLKERENRAGADELAALESAVAAAIASHRYGDALSRADKLVFREGSDPAVGVVRDRVESDAARTWASLATETVKMAEDGKGPAAMGRVEEAVRTRSIASDTSRSTELLQKIGEIRKRLDAEAAAATELKAKQDAEARAAVEKQAAAGRWQKAKAEVERLMARWELAAAQKSLEGPDAEAAGGAAERDRLARAIRWLDETKKAAISAIAGAHRSFDGKPENDHRLRLRIKGADYRATAADETTVTFAGTPGGDVQSVAWAALEPPVVAEALKRGADATHKPEHDASIAAWCIARAPDADPAVERWLMEEAERRLADATGLPGDTGPLDERIAAWAENAQKESFDRIAVLNGQSKFAEAALQMRVFRNSFGRRSWAQQHAVELDALQKSALAAGAPAEKCEWADFSAGPAPLEASAGWKAAGGILSGNGREETLHSATAGIEEIAFLVRFQKPEFRLVLTAGDADVRLEPSRPRFDLLVRREGTTPTQKALKDKGDELRLRDWHLVQIRFDGSNVKVLVNGEEEGAMAMTTIPDGFTLTLSGVSQTQAGAADLECLMVRHK